MEQLLRFQRTFFKSNIPSVTFNQIPQAMFRGEHGFRYMKIIVGTHNRSLSAISVPVKKFPYKMCYLGERHKIRKTVLTSLIPTTTLLTFGIHLLVSLTLQELDCGT